MILFNDIIGYVACVLTVIVGSPQLIKTLKTKTVASVSVPTFILYYLGTVCWILYVTLTPNKWLPLGLTDIFSILVLSLTLAAIYKYSYIAKAQKVQKGEAVTYFYPKLTPVIFTVILMGLYVIYFAFFLFTFITGFSLGNNKVLKYFFFVTAFLGVTVVFVAQTFKTIRTRSTEGLSFGICLISFFLNFLWEVSWILRMILSEEPYNFPASVVADSILKANLVEELWVGMGLQLLGVIVFLVQTVAYIIFHDWKNTNQNKKVEQPNFVLTN